MVSSIVVIGGSSGALESLRYIVARLPAGLGASVFVAIHVAPESSGFMDRILSRQGALPAVYPADHEEIVAGRIYIAPPDRHLIVKPGHVRVTRGPRENRFRPAVDPLFRSAAAAYGERVVGIVLSGGRDDGAAGLAAIKRSGGVAIVQDPDEAMAPGMPRAALQNVAVDHVLSAADMPAVVVGLIRQRVGHGEPPMKKRTRRDPAEAGAHDIHRARELGPPSPFTCPDCGGTLWQSDGGLLLQFQCHVGHRYSGESLSGAQDDALEQALWTALRALEESAELKRRMALRVSERGMPSIGQSYADQAIESEERADSIRRVLMPDAKESPEPVGAIQREDAA